MMALSDLPASIFHPMRFPLRPWLMLLPVLLFPVGLSAAEEAVAVSSVVFNGYTHERQADGKLKPEFYIFGEGGRYHRAVNDPGLDNLDFLHVARTVAGSLAKMNYLPAANEAQARLLIMVFWGSVQGSNGEDSSGSTERAASAMADFNSATPIASTGPVQPQSAEAAALDSALSELSLANEDRDRIDDRNARILGFSDALSRARFARGMSMSQDVMQELGGNRYFVVLEAYDRVTAVKYRKLKPLWTTRLSVSESGDFSEALSHMVWSSSPYFGEPSGGLRRQVFKEGSVKLDPLQIIETDPHPTKGK
jgi:hypothetical protein